MQDERELIQRSKEGEGEAFGLLYDLYLPKIYRFVLFKVNHREEAEDLTHQTFMQAWEKIGTYVHGDFPFSSWLYRIARNLVIDHYRKSKPTVSIETIEVSEERVLSYEPSNAARLDLEQEQAAVFRAIQKLTPSQQDVIIMRFVDELSLKETAAAIHKSEGAVKLLQHRALMNLKKLLRDGTNS
ncbi:MAG: hypothetical protein A3H06_01915 [Candidatus Colwellbacteria bacterium RIFCSPLOWO2_12_FULL_44_13]|uniref:RNA polymerase subunit sigma-70 n=3 Tax=Candidatus Colwelliibacteriota TaxID=1817904 RepID=A0A1G1Z3U6_9BACT|nr:MAG: hypothetical protein A3F24_01270 [Candidatus Colwellbacteria bacterium RIFCSPHIGHO2_12_FULL_44_17]OGY59283.1 MAG: hypothetical protein A3I31_01405 [Candidatus Colwellbacteria bacterium RIFCSPLOWO2_02_FULL_44_20b]OGY61423.1 MAG: hypothetical protein A3H06_01915 [Candidatus Colwellbacteria bacterium RIFCSPLOWO2_12_FULL_44_13]